MDEHQSRVEPVSKSDRIHEEHESFQDRLDKLDEELSRFGEREGMEPERQRNKAPQKQNHQPATETKILQRERELESIRQFNHTL